MGSWSDRVDYQGKAVNLGLRYQLDAMNKMLAQPANGGEREPLTILQGSWSGASASAGTHTGSGAVDTTAFNWRNRERVGRLLGLAMWHRPTLAGVWREHCHGITDGDGGVSSSAANQVKAYHNRRNGLADNGPDQGYRMLVFPLFVFPEKPHGKPGRCWVATAGKSYEQPTVVADVKRNLTRGQTFDVVAVVNVGGTYWGINPAAECVPMVNLSRTPIPSTTTPMRYPAEILGRHFQKVTLPVDGPDSGRWADEIVPPRLLTYSSEFLRVGDDGQCVKFRCYHGGATTSGSSNPRTEGRETNTDGRLAEWDGRRGRHGLEAVMSVDHLTPVKSHTVLAQIHNGDDDVATLRAEGVKDSSGKLTDRVKLYGTRGNDSHYAYLGEVKLGERFTFAFDIADGRITFVLNGKRSTKTVAATDDCFFKLGDYLQSNPDSAPGESTRSYSDVTLYGPPKVSHAA